MGRSAPSYPHAMTTDDHGSNKAIGGAALQLVGGLLIVTAIYFGYLDGLRNPISIGLGAVNNFIVYLGIMLLLGVCLTAAQTSVTTLIQERADVSMHGRVFGLMGTMYSGFLLIGMSVFGPLADVVSLPLMMILSGALLAIIALLYRIDRKFYQ